MRQFLANRKILVILFSVITSLSMIAYSIFGQGGMPTPIRWVNDTTAIAARTISRPTNALLGLWDTVEDIKNAYVENQHLKEKIGALQSLQAQNAQLKAENEEMANLLALEPTLVNKTVIAGSVITRTPNNWLDYLTIDLGSNHQVEEGMSVVADSGMVGRIVEVAPNSAKVRLMTTDNPQSMQVSASIQLDGRIVHGIIESYDRANNELIMTQIDRDADIKKGSLVVSNGLGGISPEGLPIGQVVSAKEDEFGLAQQARIKPAADYSDIRKVFVVLESNRNQATGENPEEASAND
ncbi:rod shape-determining protein MreC [Aerococcus urinaehominis]|uniref:Cell shape-determining protein MreC n=1 Tax=Aerococcus urinaehominis TaxID=128944 RepID=A0A0X8FMI8_9LACT|nr:rod shape-determining protein MreC [Aerococcus urinaehominis]